MIRKILLVLLATSIAAVLAMPSLAAFSFSFPVGTITAGPGAAAIGPTSFDTYYHNAAQAAAGTAAGFGVGGLPLMGVPFAGPGCDCFGPGVIPGLPGAGFEWGAQAAGDTTFATSFNNAGAAGLIPNICGASFAGQFPLFSLNLF